MLMMEYGLSESYIQLRDFVHTDHDISRLTLFHPVTAA